MAFDHWLLYLKIIDIGNQKGESHLSKDFKS